jgi:hypothetical protein
MLNGETGKKNTSFKKEKKTKKSLKPKLIYKTCNA